MRRRAALGALAGIGWVPPGAVRAWVRPLDRLLVWGPQACWVADGETALTRLPDALAAGLAPVPTAQGLWLVDDLGRLRCWAPADGLEDGLADAAWQVRHTVAFAAPVHALAASADGHWVAAAHGESLSLLNAQGEEIKSFAGQDLARQVRGMATALFFLSQRRSCVAAWPALGEVWEISLDPGAAPLFEGLVHDYRMAEGIATPGYLGIRRSPLDRPLPTFEFADARVPWLAGVQGAEVSVLHLDVRRRIARLAVEAARPAQASLRGPAAWWLPAGPEVHVFDTARWVRAAVHRLPAPVQALRAQGRVMWALVGAPGAAELGWVDESAAGRWLRAPGVAGPVIALHSAGPESPLLALCSDPPAVLKLDASGVVLDRRSLPTSGTYQGVAAWPGA